MDIDMKAQHLKLMDEEKKYYLLIQKVFGVLAPFYDLVTIPISRVRDKVVVLTSAAKGSRILDVATGTGQQAFAFGQRGYEVVGIDLSEAMLRVAKRKNKYGNVRFEVADATNLTFKNSSFDVSCVSFALHDMPLNVIRKTLREIVRVTRPNGKIVIVDYGLPKNRFGRFLVYRFVRLYEGQYYIKFIRYDLEDLVTTSGTNIEERISALLGAARIITGVKGDHGPQLRKF